MHSRLLQVAALLCVATLAAGKLTDKWEYIFEKCPKHICTHADHTILDWNQEEGCHCRLHPCLYDETHGEPKRHSCPDAKFPFLAFEYNKEKELVCICKEHPCPDRKCQDSGHKLEWTHDGECFCRSAKPEEL
eukprot:TRINITY_DN47640_c0_g1_i1.p1 TRINITY_DN47640_c0_g1~~TRINITY_DN47640_c0_g1_i1.p1  ORF type:complete len:133 (+),score=59.97 TRINITY_DN47640_c0_g1_i1:73-471(+)